MARRIDGIKNLTPAEKEARDKKVQRWMNQRKIERVHEAAQRHGWYYWSLAEFEDAAQVLDYGDQVIAVIEGCGKFRVEGYDPDTFTVTLRKVSSDTTI